MTNRFVDPFPQGTDRSRRSPLPALRAHPREPIPARQQLTERAGRRRSRGASCATRFRSEHGIIEGSGRARSRERHQRADVRRPIDSTSRARSSSSPTDSVDTMDKPQAGAGSDPIMASPPEGADDQCCRAATTRSSGSRFQCTRSCQPAAKSSSHPSMSIVRDVPRGLTPRLALPPMTKARLALPVAEQRLVGDRAAPRRGYRGDRLYCPRRAPGWYGVVPNARAGRTRFNGRHSWTGSRPSRRPRISLSSFSAGRTEALHQLARSGRSSMDQTVAAQTSRAR